MSASTSDVTVVDVNELDADISNLSAAELLARALNCGAEISLQVPSKSASCASERGPSITL
jgi:hypothetical protein